MASTFIYSCFTYLYWASVLLWLLCCVVFFFLHHHLIIVFVCWFASRVEPFERRHDVDSRRKKKYDSNGNDLLVAAWVMNEEESKQSTTCGVRTSARAHDRATKRLFSLTVCLSYVTIGCDTTKSRCSDRTSFKIKLKLIAPKKLKCIHCKWRKRVYQCGSSNRH